MTKAARNVWVLSLLALAGAEIAAASEIDEPFRSANRNPLVQIYGLPAAQSAYVTGAGNFNAALNLEASNNFAIENRGNEAIFMDGETYRAELNWRYGLSDRIELGLTVPFISHQNGGMDGFIEDWHDTFGLPDGDRIDYPKGQLRYQYQQGDEILLDMQQNGEGIGDVTLAAAIQLAESDSRRWALRVGVKFATGDEQRLRGSDANDQFVSLHLSDNSLAADYGVNFHLSAGSLWLGDGEILSELQEEQVWFGSSTLSWAYSDTVTLKTQIDMHSAFYDSQLKQIGDNSTQLMLGASIKVTPKLIVDLSVSEDIAVETAPDVVFQVGLRMGEW
ncbi:MAG: hypothetical protein ACJA0N_001418 [Pseudohongiellaceae bacterium]